MATEFSKLDQIYNKVIEICKERPNTSYENDICYYTRGKCSDGSFGCLIGQAILALFPEDRLQLQENERVTAKVLLENYMDKNEVDTDEASDKIRTLNHIQQYQDNKHSWGKCLEMEFGIQHQCL